MKWVLLISFLSVLLSCKQSETASDLKKVTTKPTSTASQFSENDPIIDAIFLTMERTPCFGKCPNYKITIMQSGKVTYHGIKFTEKTGKFTKKLTSKQLSKIQKNIKNIGLFDMENKYDGKVTDVAAVSLFVVYKGNKKKIYDRYGGPKELREFEKLIDSIVIDDQLIEIRD